MSSNMNYLVRSPDGKEYGPADRGTLVQWAQSGRLTGDSEVRNSLMKSWQKANEVDFLKLHIVRPTDESGVRQKVAYKVAKQENNYSLNRPGYFKFKPAGPILRAMAWTFDTLLLAVVAGGSLVALQPLINLVPEQAELLYVVHALVMLLLALGYYTISLGMTAQTIGFWFFGIMVSKPNGDPVLSLRAMVFTILYGLLGWTMIPMCFILPSQRALHDMLSGLVVIRITNREIM
jgi:uncharacterized RDD family membrane protein YckC